MKKIASITVLLLFVLCVCCGCDSNPRIASLSEPSVVVAFGNSLTFGTGANKDESYPSILSDMIGCRVINAGVPGEVTSSGLGRLRSVLQEEKADLVILCHGGNDILRKQSGNITKQNLDAMISMVRNAGADVILIGVPKPGLRLKVPSLYQELADKHRIPFDSDTLPEILSTSSLKSDHIHPNAAGYRRIAQALVDLIKKSQGT